ncbi:MAG: tRNA (adenosine(37)-N6)-dimethylallyltransferase MiaA [Clostridia bacterium]|nr:tRNA (adenosine(37)-N6)-dimethylallyltransferase MiaA [Clostridia bacterium]
MKPKVVVIVGPTASGKTAVSIELAKILNGEIISADSMQIYKEMNIGSAKPTEEEMQGIYHHMIDVVDPTENFNVAKYKEMAEECIKKVLAKGKVPIIVGGTGLYVSTLTNGIEFSEIESDIEYRKELEKIAEQENGINILFNQLKEIDPEATNIIDKNNVRRVIRALEIFRVTGKTKTQVDKESIKELKYNYLIFGMLWDRQELYDRIDQRVDIMVEMGLVEEVEKLYKKGISSTAIQGLGYKEIIEYLDEKITLEEAIEKIKQETRRYAKRQMTWFKRDKNIIWLNAKNKEEVVKDICQSIREE